MYCILNNLNMLILIAILILACYFMSASVALLEFLHNSCWQQFSSMVVTQCSDSTCAHRTHHHHHHFIHSFIHSVLAHPPHLARDEERQDYRSRLCSTKVFGLRSLRRKAAAGPVTIPVYISPSASSLGLTDLNFPIKCKQWYLSV